jgi:hypothetical protein
MADTDDFLGSLGGSHARFSGRLPPNKPLKKSYAGISILTVLIAAVAVLGGFALLHYDTPPKPNPVAAEPLPQARVPVHVPVQQTAAASNPDTWENGPKTYAEALQTLKAEAEILAGLNVAFEQEKEDEGKAEEFAATIRRNIAADKAFHAQQDDVIGRALEANKDSHIRSAQENLARVERSARLHRDKGEELLAAIVGQEAKVKRARDRKEKLDR